MIIINADHGPFGFGFNSRGTNKVVKGILDKLIGLDNLGVLLAIRWPHGVKKDVHGIKTNANLFRHVFSYLSDSDRLLVSLVDDHGFITKGKSKDMALLKVAHDGRILDQMVEMGLVR
jgi:hypothetical protein